MIARIWTGSTNTGDSPKYVSHLHDHTLPQLASIAGYRGSYVLSRDRAAGRVDFTVITLWESLDAIRRFAGDDAEAAVVPADAQALLASFDTRASHWSVELVDSGVSPKRA